MKSATLVTGALMATTMGILGTLVRRCGRREVHGLDPLGCRAGLGVETINDALGGDAALLWSVYPEAGAVNPHNTTRHRQSTASGNRALTAGLVRCLTRERVCKIDRRAATQELAPNLAVNCQTVKPPPKKYNKTPP